MSTYLSVVQHMVCMLVRVLRTLCFVHRYLFRGRADFDTEG